MSEMFWCGRRIADMDKDELIRVIEALNEKLAAARHEATRKAKRVWG